MNEHKKYVDESWKDSVEEEKSKVEGQESVGENAAATDSDKPSTEGDKTFLNYISSLAFQAMILLGLAPNPMAGNVIERDLKQAKFFIDTLIMLQKKTAGNLTKEEEDFLNASAYELQMKFVEESAKPEPNGSEAS